MTQFMGRFSVTAGARDLAVCRANGVHAEPDLRGRCFMCGLLLPDPELPLVNQLAADYHRSTSQ
ncbi:MAG: hypothetical protein ACJ768_19705 [Gaiellaceae bacterium]